MSHLFPLDDELGRLNYGCGSGVSWATASHDLDAMFGYLREQYLLQNQKPSDIVAFLIQCLQQHPTTSTKVTCSGHIATQTSASITTATPSSTSNITAFSAGATVLFPHPHSMTPLSLNTNAFSDISPKLSSSSLLRARSQHDLDPLRFNSRPQEVEASHIALARVQHHFGVDIGGSLCKITFFEPRNIAGFTSSNIPSAAVSPVLTGHAASASISPNSVTTSADALQRQRAFVLQSTHYGSCGVRDPLLAFEYQCGTFHFINFETRRMAGAMQLLAAHQLLPAKPRRPRSHSQSHHTGVLDPCHGSTFATSLPDIKLNSTTTDTTTPKVTPSSGESTAAGSPLPSSSHAVIMATGGGAFKYSDIFRDQLHLDMIKKDELTCLLAGLNFLLNAVSDECFYISDASKPTETTSDLSGLNKPIYPYILVNIGSGVSILRVDSASVFERVGGTCLGGGTALGLFRLLTEHRDFTSLIELSEQGDSEKIDMLVGDIYGGDYNKFNLKSSTIASAFGKMLTKDDPWMGICDADIARSLLKMIGQNIAQLAYQSAVQHKVSRILFAGNFLRKNYFTMGSVSHSIDYWSSGGMKALFLKHEGYCGSLGAFLLQEDAASNED